MQKIALTGGPSGGKTTFLELARQNFGGQIETVPEAATMLYSGGFPRVLDVEGRKDTQLAIYHVQVQLERLILRNCQAQIALCDRGTLDGLAYWPGTALELWAETRSSYDAELARYDWVLHLETANRTGYDNSNQHRIETHAEALILDQKIKEIWSKHPKQLIIQSNYEFIKKMEIGLELLTAILNGNSFDKVKKLCRSGS